MAFATTVLDLSRSLEMWTRGPFDYLHYYLAASLLKRVALENEVSTTYELRESFFSEDLVVAQLTRSLLSPVRHGEPLSQLALDEVALLLGAHVLQRYCGSLNVVASARRGLQTWQSFAPRKCCVGDWMAAPASTSSPTRVRCLCAIFPAAFARALAFRPIST